MYTTAEILIDKYGDQLMTFLSSKDPGATTPDLTVINREVGRVDGIIDGYLRNRYTLPLSQVPTEMAGYAEDIAIARLYRCFPERTVPEDVTKAEKAALEWLKDIQKGLVTLSVEPVAAPSASGEPGTTGFFRTSKRPEDRLFSDSTLDKFTGR